MRLATKVIRARKRAGLNPNQLATQCGLDSATIYNIESGKRPSITSITALKLSSVLDVAAADLLGV